MKLKDRKVSVSVTITELNDEPRGDFYLHDIIPYGPSEAARNTRKPSMSWIH